MSSTLDTSLRKTLTLSMLTIPSRPRAGISVTPNPESLNTWLRRSSQTLGDDADFHVSDRQSFFDQHAYHVSRGKPGCITDHVQWVVQVLQYRGNGNDKDYRLDKPKSPGDSLATAYDE